MKNFLFLILLLIQIPIFAQSWADSVMRTLTPDQRVAQLIHVAVTPGNASETNTARQLIKEYGIGGVLIMRSQPAQGARLLNDLQSNSQVPLLVSVDGEWGLDMRIDSTIAFPYAMGLGAVDDIALLREMGREVARECLRMGIHMNFAPVMDVNINPNNPVIGFRSFGENPEEVRRRGMEYAEGMAEGGILCTMKHFPGHGDTGVDSHVGLPVISHKKDRLESVELFPFSSTMGTYASSIGVMVGHLHVPELDPTPNLPASLSKPIITDLLKKEMGFQGLVVTDALNMQGVVKYFKAGEIEVKALEAGNDMLLFPTDVPKAIRMIRAAINSGRLNQEQIDASCRKVLMAKERVGLDKYQPVELAGLVGDLNTLGAEVLNQDITAATLTLLRNRDEFLPLLDLEDKKIATVAVGVSKRTPFQHRISDFNDAFHYTLGKEATFSAIQSVRKSLGKMDKVIVCVHAEGKRPGTRTRLSASLRDFVNEMARTKEVAIVYFRNPYTLKHFQDMPKADGLLLAYQDGAVQQEMAAELIFGKRSILTGNLPVTVSPDFPLGDGVKMPLVALAQPDRPMPEAPVKKPSATIDPASSLKETVDSIAIAGLEAGAYPGCQVYVAHKGEVIFHETYGFHTYTNQRPVKKDDIYDMASITKCSGPLPALMKLHGQGRFGLDMPFHTYWADWAKGNKSTLVVREVLAHQAKLLPYIPFYTLEKKKDGTLKRRAFRTKPSRRFAMPISDSLYQRTNYRKRMYKLIRKTPLNETRDYVSGLSFLLYPEIITQMTGIPYERYLRDSVYLPIGAKTLCFNAGKYFPLERIIPTERDSFFRYELLHGVVHDEAAVMFGGVSGNAGLFGNAEDLAKLWQMYMNMGELNGVRIIPEATLKEFTKVQFPQNNNRRGLGFDKPMLENPEEGYAAPSASPSSFGHSGYTGTMVWADPENELLFIFLSNRVHPTRKNRKLYQLNIRPGIHEAFYRYLGDLDGD